MKKSVGGKSAYLQIGFWRHKDGSIHITASGVPGFHVAVNEDGTKPNGHPTLFARLDRCLKESEPAKKKAPRKDASQTALSIVEQVTGGKLKA